MRSVAQAVSFEVRLAFILFRYILLFKAPSFASSALLRRAGSLFIVSLWVLWLFCILVELNRTPFDLGEAERELISGLNIEYSGGLFGVVFIREYINIITLRVIRVTLGSGLCLTSAKGLLFTGFILYFLI